MLEAQEPHPSVTVAGTGQIVVAVAFVDLGTRAVVAPGNQVAVAPGNLAAVALGNQVVVVPVVQETDSA